MSETTLQIPQESTGAPYGALPSPGPSAPAEKFVRKSIGPAGAAKLLKANIDNRPLSRYVVDRYARAMREGRWVFNPSDAIVVDAQGRLRNGQHRLQAVIASGATIEFLLCVDASPEVFAVLDTGRHRGGADTLAIMGVTQSSLVAAVLVWISRERKAHERAAAGLPYRLTMREPVDNDLALKLWEEHRTLQDSIPVRDHMSPKRLLPGSIAVWLHYRFSKINAELTTSYFDGFMTGSDIADDTPEFAVRRHLLNNLASPKKVIDFESLAAMVVKGWNRRFAGKSMKICQWSTLEGFPRVSGEDPRAPYGAQAKNNGAGGAI